MPRRTTWPGGGDARRFLSLLFDEPGRVVELRVPKPAGRRWTIAGYFDDPEALVRAAAKIDGCAEAVYVTLNPLNPALLARAANVTKSPMSTTTADHDVQRRHWLLLDFDPARPKGVSATDAEHDASIERAKEARAALAKDAWPDPVLADSGNGAHLLYRLDMPCDDEGLVARALKGLAFRFDDEVVQVDCSVGNPSRICKLYGTLAAKGDSTADRPHRRARLLEVPEKLRPVPGQLLEWAAEAVPDQSPTRSRRGEGEALDVDSWLAEHGLEVTRRGPWNNGQRWILKTCPWDETHSDRSAYVVQFASGALAAGCHHSSCQDKGWKELRELLEPDSSPRGELPDQTAPTKRRRRKTKDEDGPDDEPEDGEPRFVIGEELRDLVPDVWKAVIAKNVPPRLFRRGGALVNLKLPEGEPPLLDQVTVDGAHGYVFRAGRWRKKGSKKLLPAHPPKDIARDLVERPHTDLPRLEAIISAPAFDQEWRLVATDGYHPDSALYLHLNGLEIPPVPEQPSQAEVEAALGALDDVLCDFPFARPSDRAHALAAFVQPFVRRAITGPTPVYDIEAPVPGTGKSLLADLVARVATGSSLPTSVLSRQEEELRKLVTTLLFAGRSIVCFDNVSSMAFGTLAAAVTADPWCDRLLGKSQQLRLPNKALWAVTANNPSVTTEIARRCVRIRLDPRVEKPWERSGFRHADVRSYVTSRRGRLISSILTLVRGWLASGAPRGETTMGSFESWSQVIGGILGSAGVPGFLDDREELLGRADKEAPEWREFFLSWSQKLGSAPKKAGELAAFCERHGLLEETLSRTRTDTARARSTCLGRALAAREGRVFAGKRLERHLSDKRSQALWALGPPHATEPAADIPDVRRPQHQEGLSTQPSSVESVASNSPASPTSQTSPIPPICVRTRTHACERRNQQQRRGSLRRAGTH